MANVAFKLDPQSVITNAWTVVGGGTAAEALTKTGIAGGGSLGAESAPGSNEPRLTSTVGLQNLELHYGSSTKLGEIDTLLKAGGTIISVRLLVYGEEKGTTGKSLKVTFAGKTAEPELTKAVATWMPAFLPESGVLTTAKALEETAVGLQHITGKELWIWESYIEVVVEEGAATKKVAGAATAGAVASASTSRISQPPASGASGVTSHVRVNAPVSRLAQAPASLSAGATVAVGAIVKTERGPVAAKVSSGAAVRAEALRRAQTGARASSGASVAARTQRVAQAIPRVSAGAVVSATVRRVAQVAAVVTSSAGVRASAASHFQLRPQISAGVSIRANVVRIGQDVEPPTSTPIAGHVAVGQRGRIGVHRGRIPTRNVGRAER